MSLRISKPAKMSLVVEVAGYGLCKTPTPYSVLVICVQQENFQAWAVYRKYAQFQLLAEQLRALYPSIPSLPNSDLSDLSAGTLEALRVDMNRWLQIAGTLMNIGYLFPVSSYL